MVTFSLFSLVAFEPSRASRLVNHGALCLTDALGCLGSPCGDRATCEPAILPNNGSVCTCRAGFFARTPGDGKSCAGASSTNAMLLLHDLLDGVCIVCFSVSTHQYLCCAYCTSSLMVWSCISLHDCSVPPVSSRHVQSC